MVQTANGLDQVTARTLSSRGFGLLGSVTPAAKLYAQTSLAASWQKLTTDPVTGAFANWWDVPLATNAGRAVRIEALLRGILPGAPPAIADATVDLVVPPASESLSYDGVGQLQGDAFWSYTWDGAGRLVTLTRKAGTFAKANALSETLAYGYDADGRRTSRTHITSYPGNVTETEHSTVLWAGSLPVLELRTKDSVNLGRRWFQWGPDLSGTLEGEGGIGGLAAIVEENVHGNVKRTLLPVGDGMGNVTAVIDAANGQTVANYEYGPFGEPLGGSGEADACPFRWQTKWYDTASAQYYFGYRHYDPRTGRWLSRDPAGEAGGFNLYGYCGNDPVNRHDALGLEFPAGFGGLIGGNPAQVMAEGRSIAGAMANGYSYEAAARASKASTLEFREHSRAMGKGVIAGAAMVAPYAAPELEGVSLLMSVLQDAGVISGTAGLQQLGFNALDRRPLLQAVPESMAGGSVLGGGVSGVFRVAPLLADLGKSFLAPSSFSLGGLNTAWRAAEAGSILNPLGGSLETSIPLVGSGNAYSVSFRTKMIAPPIPKGTRFAHFSAANEALFRTMDADPWFAQSLRQMIPEIDTVRGTGEAPRNWVWNHLAAEPGVMELVPTVQHWAPNPLWSLFHPSRDGKNVGGFKLWGDDY